MFDMLHSLPEKHYDMLILYPVIDFFPISARLHKVHLAQTAHMV
jgi:hypothetical protein